MGEQTCAIILKFGPVVQEYTSMAFKDFSILISGGHFVWQS